MNRNITDVFFDLDHTLWDFEKNSALAFETVFKMQDLDVNMTEFLKFYVPINREYWERYRKDEITQKQLFFVPYNKATLAISHSYKQFAFDYQFLYNGFVFTRADNNPQETIKAYQVSNLGISYDFKFLESTKLGIQVMNIMNLAYQSLEQRPLSGRNFNMYINLKF